MQTLSPAEFMRLIADPTAQLVDVREPAEWELARLPGAQLIPLGELVGRAAELDPQRPVALYCHHGVRSELAGRQLELSGFGAVAHLGGGIDAWSLTVDPQVPRY